MTHGDDNGLRTPPRLAPIEVVVVPIWKSDEERARLLEAADRLKEHVTGWGGRGDDRVRVRIDSREGMKPGAKYYEWELRGVPLRIELGPRDLANNACVTVRRDRKRRPLCRSTASPRPWGRCWTTYRSRCWRPRENAVKQTAFVSRSPTTASASSWRVRGVRVRRVEWRSCHRGASEG